jgi:uncharacterized OB-fold protein
VTGRAARSPFGSGMPLPVVDQDTEAFWAACREHRLVVQRCAECGAHRFAPAPVCHRCHSFETELEESSGRGRLFTWTVVHQVMHPAVADAAPYNVAVVELDDCGGVLLTTNIVGVDEAELVAGLPVQVWWDDIDDDVTVPRFAPRRDGADEEDHDDHR